VRNAFIEELIAQADADPRICLVVGDLGFSVVESFRDRHPDRFLNAGVAEQTMTGVAAGWALADGRTVFTYSIANFPTLRCLEQVRNDVCHHRANVKIVAVGGGVAYGAQGHTHFGLEDIAIMRTLPHMMVVVPGDPHEARAACRLACRTEGPMYIRLGKSGEPNCHPGPVELTAGHALRLREGSVGTVIACGPIVEEALLAADRLRRESGLALRVLSMPIVHPIDRDAIIDASTSTAFLLTVEEHALTGGLGSAVAEVIIDSGLPPRVRRLGVAARIERIGSQRFLWKETGIDAEAIATAARQMATECKA
jgi:transketolase